MGWRLPFGGLLAIEDCPLEGVSSNEIKDSLHHVHIIIKVGSRL